MRIILAAAVSTAIVSAATLPALAQSVQVPQTGLATPAMACADYKRAADGSWTPVKEVPMVFPDGTTLTIAAGTTFPAHGTWMGMPWALLLDQKCGAK